MIHIYFKEINGFLDSLIAYVVIGVFLTAIGLLTWVFPDTSVLEGGYADMMSLFSVGPYVLIFLVPAVTMRSLAEERKMGTLELLFTRPLTDWQVVLGKFFAAWTLVLIALVPTIVYYFSLYYLGSPQGNIDTPGVIGSYVGIALLGGAFCGVGLLASSLTPNQVVAFIIAAFLCFIAYAGIDGVAAIPGWEGQALAIRQAGML